jgi:putative component of membrane protein insertase Oxa1/YidC/SpoIIIJ protein YidD
MRTALFVFILAIISRVTFSQTQKTDLMLLKGIDTNIPEQQVKIQRKKLNLGFSLYQSSIGLYQKHISAQIGANCVFEVSCSRFSRQLVDEFGIVKGFFLSLDRVGRCNKLTLIETSPARLNTSGKVVEQIDDYCFH